MASPRSSAQKKTAETSYPITANWSLEQLLAMDKAEVLSRWNDLPAVSLEELQGHFAGVLPNAGDADAQARAFDFMYNENSEKGYWLGKAYRKTGPNQGEGYNRWRFPGGKVVRDMRFTAEIGTSLLDGKPPLLMYYGAYNAARPTFVDEIRKLDDYVYLGVGSILDEAGKRNPGHFALVGPTDDWVGGAIGDPVPGFIKPAR